MSAYYKNFVIGKINAGN